MFTATNVAGEQVAEFAVILADIQHYLGTSENVPSIAKGQRDPVGNEYLPVIIYGDKLPRGLVGIGHSVKGFNGWFAALGALAADVFGV